MKILLGYRVIMEHEDEAPETFGDVLLEMEPFVGEIIQLKWLDGRDAYKAEVTRTDFDRGMIYVKRVEGMLCPTSSNSCRDKRQGNSA